MKPAKTARDNLQITHRSTRKGCWYTRGCRKEPPRLFSGRAAMSAAAHMPVLAPAAGQQGAEALKETPAIAVQQAGRQVAAGLPTGAPSSLTCASDVCPHKGPLPVLGAFFPSGRQVKPACLRRGSLPKRQLWSVARSGSPRPSLCGEGWRALWQGSLLLALRSMPAAWGSAGTAVIDIDLS